MNHTISFSKGQIPRNGQSIIEMLIAISLLTTALFSMLGLLARAFFLNRVATSQTTATYLAAEGIELTKSLIDHDVYGLKSWGACCSAGNYYADYFDTNLHAGSQGALLFDPVTHMYGYSAHLPAADKPVATTFTRTIRITKPTPTEIDVESTVQWSSGSFTNQQVTLDDHFYDWRP